MDRRSCVSGQPPARFMLCCAIGLSIFTLAAPAKNQTVVIGFVMRSSMRDAFTAAEMAVEYINSREDLLPSVTLEMLIDTTDELLPTFSSASQACQQVQKGASVIFGASGSNTVKAIYTLCGGVKIPLYAHLATDPSLSTVPIDKPYLFKMSSSDTKQSAALVKLAQTYSWSRFSIIADLTDYGRHGMQEFETMAAEQNWDIVTMNYFYPYENASSIDLRKTLLEIRNRGSRVVIMNCLGSHAEVIMKQAYELDMTGTGWAWIGTDGITVGAGLFNPCAEVPLYLQGILGTRPAGGMGQLRTSFLDLWEVRNNGTSLVYEIPSMRLFDAVLVYAYGLHDYIQDGYELVVNNYTSPVCQGHVPPHPAQHDPLLDYLGKAEGPGTMNYLSFTELRTPSVAVYDVVNLQRDGWVKVGNWDESRSEDTRLEMNGHNTVVFSGGNTNLPLRDTEVDLKNVTLRVVTLLEEPFVMKSSEPELIKDPTKIYKGFCIDLLDELATSLNFKYELHDLQGEEYGAQDSKTGKWNGLVGELIADKADMAMGAMTITYERQQDIEFTKPFMDLGLSIVIAKEVASNSLLSFLEPFKWTLWAAVVAAFLVCGVATTICSFLSPYGYHGMYVQRLDKSDHRAKANKDVLRFWDSLWYSFSSWMQQGADISPRCFSGRLIYGFWWFAVMVISATYTANLAAFLTVARLSTGINSLTELANQREVKYGTVANSAVHSFFQEQTSQPYTRMVAFMDAEGTFVKNSSEGIERVRNSYGVKGSESDRYAFIWDSAPLEYAVNQKPCTIQTIGSLFNNFGYGIGFRKKSPYTSSFSLQVLNLRENGRLESLKNRYIMGGECASAEEESGQSVEGEQATLEDMAGVFLMLVLGMLFSLLAVCCEFCVASYKESRNKKSGLQPVSMCGAMQRRVGAVMSDIRHQCRRVTSDAADESSETESNQGGGQNKRPRMMDYYQKQYSDAGASNHAFSGLGLARGQYSDAGASNHAFSGLGVARGDIYFQSANPFAAPEQRKNDSYST